MNDQVPPILPDLNSGRGQIAENCAEYYLFLVKEQANNQTQLQQLEILRKAAINLCNSLTNDYIWQRDGFNLELKSSQGKHPQPWRNPHRPQDNFQALISDF